MEELLRNILIKYPKLPIKFFVAGDCNLGDYPYEECSITKVSVDNVTLYNEEYMDEEDYADRLYNDLYDEFESEEELNKHVDEIITKTKFEKTICVFIG